jgi:hypothetical protein
MHPYEFMNYGMCIVGIKNIAPQPESIILSFPRRMENEEMAHIEAHYQKKLEDVKNIIA